MDAIPHPGLPDPSQSVRPPAPNVLTSLLISIARAQTLDGRLCGTVGEPDQPGYQGHDWDQGYVRY
jgi:hypothetical protein